MMNDEAMDMMPEESTNLLSADRINPTALGEDAIAHYPTEFLNTLNLSGLPPHRLTLKEGCPLILIRNINLKKGLCNGTRLKLINISDNKRVLTVKILNGTHINTIAYIPRIDISPSETDFPIPFQRRQFPVKIAFALTINRAQGQSFNRTAIYLPQPVFAHGQFYVFLGRSADPNSTKIKVDDIPGVQGRFPHKEGIYTRNIVYHEALTL